MSDIIADIDELIDEQLDAGEPETGYSFGDPEYPLCPRGCGRKWHGMAVTLNIEVMKLSGDGMDPDYRYRDDASAVLCPAPDFVAPSAPPDEHAMAVLLDARLDSVYAALGLPSFLGQVSASSDLTAASIPS